MRGARSSPRHFWALRDVDLEIAPGRMVGIIGRNGAGKSTLLRMISGLLKPDAGTIRVNGRVSGLLELGAGCHPDLTGRENIYIAGIVGGLRRREVTARLGSILAFAELGDFIDRPMRCYSSGMKMRLAFSVAVHVEPEILLVDEVLAVGDVQFQRKCLARILEFKQRGCTIVVVSHDVGMVRQICDDAVWLQQGLVACAGIAPMVVARYLGEPVPGEGTPEFAGGGAPDAERFGSGDPVSRG
jgi:lipopolysaccharide transport system ATP-binding protein